MLPNSDFVRINLIVFVSTTVKKLFNSFEIKRTGRKFHPHALVGSKCIAERFTFIEYNNASFCWFGFGDHIKYNINDSLEKK